MLTENACTGMCSDALNLAMAASPPLRVLDAAGMIIGVVYAPPFSLSQILDHYT